MRFSTVAAITGLVGIVSADGHWVPNEPKPEGHWVPDQPQEQGHHQPPPAEQHQEKPHGHWVPNEGQGEGHHAPVTECLKETITVYGAMGPKPTPATTDIWTKEDKATSVKYNKEQTSIYLPSAGLYENPYHKGETITAAQPTYATVDKWWTTVCAYPTAGANERDAVQAIYQDVTIVEVKAVVVNVEKHEVISTKADAPAYTPAQPPSPPVESLGPQAPAGPAGPSKTHIVELRAEGGLRYIPDRVNAEIGDTIQFKFFSAAHSVSQSTFDKPCELQRNAQGMPVFDTELVPNQANGNGPEFERLYHVTSKDPQWFYCKQTNNDHCGKGMVFGINPNGKMDQFIDNAKKSGGTPADAPQQADGHPLPQQPAPHTIPGIPHNAKIVTVSGGIMPDGSGSTLAFDPPFLNGMKTGEVIYFDFLAKNHTLTQSTLKTPCTKKEGGAEIVDTGFENANPEGIPGLKVVSHTVTTEDTQYFYCKQANGASNGHCRAGMLFAINIEPPLFEEFERNAKSQND